MGPNGSGKSTLSHVIMGRPGYEVLGGSVTLDGVDLLALRAVGAGPGRPLPRHAVPHRGARRGRRRRARGRLRRPRAATPPRSPGRIIAEAERIGFDDRFLHRAHERRPVGRREEAQRDPAARRAPAAIAILDELDSGLDVDALRACARRIEAATNETGLGVLAITHYNRLLHELRRRPRARPRRRPDPAQRRARARPRAGDHRLRRLGGRRAGRRRGEADPFADPLA